MKREKITTSTCHTGFHAMYPTGYACAGEGIALGDTPPAPTPPPAEDEAPRAGGERFVIDPPARDAALPYRYYFVKEDLVPEYHRLPSRDEQRDALAFRDRYLALKRTNERLAGKLLAGELTNELKRPAIVRGFLDRGFFVAGSGIETRASRRFVRTVRGRYIKEAQLEPRSGASFHGVELGKEHALPIAWAVRASRPMRAITLADGQRRFADDETVPALERLAIVPWLRRERVEDRVLHVLTDGHYVRDWFLAVAEPIPPPEGVTAEEPWVHVDVGEQTLVLYRGPTPIYATLVSSGIVGHDTPVGLFSIRSKHIAETMSNIGGDEADRYAIEDVPWTQYFRGSIALHGAFWHERFGLKRSHGCVNLAPIDAHRIFDETWPAVPEGWHGVSSDRTGLRPSHVYITP